VEPAAMKGCLFVAAVALVLLAGLLVFLRLTIGQGAEDDRHLTSTVVADTLRSVEEDNYAYSQHRGHRVTYRYEVEGQWYRSDEWLPEEIWVGGPVKICVNPEDPAEHVVPTRSTAECGDGNVGSQEAQRATKVAAPKG